MIVTTGSEPLFGMAQDKKVLEAARQGYVFLGVKKGWEEEGEGEEKGGEEGEEMEE